MTAAGELRDAARTLEQYPADATRAAVGLLRAAVEGRLKIDTGGDQRLSGLGKDRLTVTGKTTEIVTGVAEGRVTAGPRYMVGPWRWLNDGVRPYVTAAGNQHPGTRPKRTFDDPVEQVLPDAERQLGVMFDRLPLLS